jgi:tetratricopeptide (TPR) repeat protein
MKRLIAGITLLVLTAGGVYGYMVSRRERTYGRVVTEGEAALASGNYSAAVEAFSGAIALKPEAMLGHLKRGEAYRRRGELDPAERDLLQAAELDPTATQPQEQLGDVALAERHYASAARTSGLTIGPRASCISSRTPSTTPAGPQRPSTRCRRRWQ